MDSRDVANDCPGATVVDINTLDLITDQGADVGRKRLLRRLLKRYVKEMFEEIFRRPQVKH